MRIGLETERLMGGRRPTLRHLVRLAELAFPAAGRSRTNLTFLSRPCLLALFLLALLGVSGCSSVIKSKKKVDVPLSYRQARTASLPELLDIVNKQYAGISSLVVSRFEVEFQGGSAELGFIESYPRAKGYLVAQRPNSVYVNILNPLTSSTVVAMAAVSEDFRIWAPRENKYLVGKTTVELEDEKPIFNVRPQHLLNALLIDPISNGDGAICFLEEDQDPSFKYYVLNVVDTSQGTPCLRRKVWIERSTMNIVRQQYYDCGSVASVIHYGQPAIKADVKVPGDVRVERPKEHYTIRLRFEADGLELNRSIKADRFDIPQPPGAEVVQITGR